MTESIGRQFWKMTQNQHLPESPQRLGLPQPPLEMEYDQGESLINLPKVDGLHKPEISLWEAIDKRVTLRRYSDARLSLDELSLLLWATQGVKEITTRPSTLRTVPSAGARHAFETFLLVNRVEDLEPGIYRYIATEHALLPYDLSPDVNQRITEGTKNQQHVANSAVTFLWAAVIERMTWRYPERGYRYLLMDAGHVCQNLYLAAVGLGCGVCGIAAFDDDLLNQALKLDGENVFVCYAASLGKRIVEEKE